MVKLSTDSFSITFFYCFMLVNCFEPYSYEHMILRALSEANENSEHGMLKKIRHSGIHLITIKDNRYKDGNFLMFFFPLGVFYFST